MPTHGEGMGCGSFLIGNCCMCRADRQAQL